VRSAAPARRPRARRPAPRRGPRANCPRRPTRSRTPARSRRRTRRSALDAAVAPPRSLYFDLRSYAREQASGGTPFTPAIPAFYALREALAEHAKRGGWPARGDQYRRLAERVRAGLAACGIRPHLAPEESSAVLRSYRLPDAMPYDVLHAELKKRGFVIYAGQAALRERVFRISTMGEIGDPDIARFLDAIADICRPQREKEKS
jgi:2-aminoethylphosphonate-pyruvate transaminase